MPFAIYPWMNELIRQLQRVFKRRLQAVGLQGSFRRGEQTPSSDIDAVVVLDTLTAQDIFLYKEILSHMPTTLTHPVCGFFGGKEDLKNWPRADLFQFMQDTHWLYGGLADVLPPPVYEDARQAVQTAAGNIYHALVHTWVHGQLSADFLKLLGKSAFFMLQAAHYMRTGRYITTKWQLLLALSQPDEREILRFSLTPPPQEALPAAAARLLNVCQRLLAYCQRPSGN